MKGTDVIHKIPVEVHIWQLETKVFSRLLFQSKSLKFIILTEFKWQYIIKLLVLFTCNWGVRGGFNKVNELYKHEQKVFHYIILLSFKIHSIIPVNIFHGKENSMLSFLTYQW